MNDILATITVKEQYFMAKNIISRAIKAKGIPQHTILRVNGNSYLVLEDSLEKIVVGPDYNYTFDKISGCFVRWGENLNDDPKFSPIGPEIADAEISVNGCTGGCSFCYKGNTNATPNNMTLDTWKQLLDKFPKNLTQVAFGITDLDTNPDFLEILKYTKSQGVIPNFTTHGMNLTKEMAQEYAKVCGAIAVSAYAWNKDLCYDAIKMLTDAGMTQVNIHCVLSHDLMEHAMSVVDDAINDPRLEKLKAIVFLGLKPKGRAANRQWKDVPISFYNQLVNKCLKNDIGFGFDSCSAPKFELTMKSIEGIPEDFRKQMLASSESCESYLFSVYVNADGVSWACSFTENEKGFNQFDVLHCDDFLNSFWNADIVRGFRNKCISSGELDGCRKCIVFPIINP